MKTKLLSALILCCLTATGLNAQTFWDDSEPQRATSNSDEGKVCLRLGITGCAVMSGLSSSVYPSFGIRPGIGIGAAFQIRFLSRDELSTAQTGLLAFQPEVRFDMAGGNSSEGKLGLFYVTMPLMFQVYPIKGLYIEAGPTLALNVGHTPSSVLAAGYEFSLDRMRANDIQVSAGLGYAFDNGLAVGARFNKGFQSLAGNMPWKNWNLQIGVTYTFKLGMKNVSGKEDIFY
ncbi:MAG: PorT family protein [Bacteroidales bacterium]|nr:PorT family protein [Bacteroidales bacterium]